MKKQFTYNVIVVLFILFSYKLSAAPSLTSVAINSDNVSNTAFAVAGNTVILSITASEDIIAPSVVIEGRSANVTIGADQQHWTATVVMQAGDAAGTVPFTIDYSNLAFVPGVQVISTTDGSSVDFIPGAVLTAPVAGLTGVSIEPTFAWTLHAVAGVNYKLIIAADAAFSTVLFTKDISNASPNSYSITELADKSHFSTWPLANGTKYYWKISAFAGALEVPSAGHFTTAASPNLALSVPANGATVFTTSVMFTWYLNSTSTGYRYAMQYLQQSTPPTEVEWAAFVNSYTTDIFKTVPDILAGKPYYWRVIVQRNTAPYDVISYSPVYSFNTSGGSTVTVTPSFPVNAVVSTNEPTLYWYLDQYAEGLTYNINYSKSAHVGINGALDDPSTVNINTASGNLFTTLPTLEPGTVYYWQVQANYAAGASTSAWSQVVSFITNGAGTTQVPVIAYPTGGITVYTTSPIFTWYLGTFASGLFYDLQFSESASFASVTTASTLTADQLYLQVNGFVPGHTYYWRVLSRNSAGNVSAWSETPVVNGVFTIAGGTSVSYPVISNPINNPTLYSLRPVLNWYLEGSSLGISGYTIKWKKTNNAPSASEWASIAAGANANEGNVYVTPNTATTYTIPVDLSYDGHYYWYVDAGDASLARTADFTIIGPATTGAPVLSQPSDKNTVYQTSVLLSWFVNGAASEITGYDLMYSNSDVWAPAATTTIDHSTLSSQTYTITNLTIGATYWWKVRAWYGSSVTSAWSDTWSFSVDAAASNAVQPLIGGPNNVTVTTSSPQLSWLIPVSAKKGTTYELEYAAAADFKNSTVKTSDGTSLKLDALNSNSNYYWRVRAKTSDGKYSYYSPTGKFSVQKVLAVQPEKTAPVEYALGQNYPNPFNPSTRISYSLPQNSFVTIKIYDMLGREIKTLVNGDMTAGIHDVEWLATDNSGNKVSSGMYLYKMTAGNFVVSKKLTLIK